MASIIQIIHLKSKRTYLIQHRLKAGGEKPTEDYTVKNTPGLMILINSILTDECNSVENTSISIKFNFFNNNFFFFMKMH